MATKSAGASLYLLLLQSAMKLDMDVKAIKRVKERKIEDCIPNDLHKVKAVIPTMMKDAGFLEALSKLSIASSTMETGVKLVGDDHSLGTRGVFATFRTLMGNEDYEKKTYHLEVTIHNLLLVMTNDGGGGEKTNLKVVGGCTGDDKKGPEGKNGSRGSGGPLNGHDSSGGGDNKGRDGKNGSEGGGGPPNGHDSGGGGIKGVNGSSNGIDGPAASIVDTLIQHISP